MKTEKEKNQILYNALHKIVLGKRVYGDHQFIDIAGSALKEYNDAEDVNNGLRNRILEILKVGKSDTDITQMLMPLFEQEAEACWDYCYLQGTRNVGNFGHHGGIELKTKYLNERFKSKKVYL